MIQEQFPESASLRTQWAMWRDQGTVQSCSGQGPANTLSLMLQRWLQRDINLSARFIWWNLRGKEKSIDSAAKVIRENGCCLDSLCPYDIALLDTPPSPAALDDAKNRQFRDLRTIPIAGVESVKRAICQGSAITFKMGNPGSEHISCIDGYDEEGVHVWDSNSITPAITMPWADVESGGRIKQMVRWAGIPLVPHPDYIEGDVPTLINGVLSLPKALVWIGWNSDPKSIVFKNVRLQMVKQGWISSGHEDVQDIVFWHSNDLTLYVPKLIVDSTILHNVKMVGPTATLIEGEQCQ